MSREQEAFEEWQQEAANKEPDDDLTMIDGLFAIACEIETMSDRIRHGLMHVATAIERYTEEKEPKNVD